MQNEKAENSAKIANEMGKVLKERVKEYYNVDNIQIIDEAQVENTPSNINHIRDIMIFIAIGMMVAVIYVFVADILDFTIKTKEDIEKQFDIPILAVTPLLDEKVNQRRRNNELVVRRHPNSPIAEIFRTLRTNIQFTNRNKKLQSILITSTMPREGKSWISSNLAVTFAQTGKKVILVDADMRKGRQFNIFKIPPKPGLSNYLLEVLGKNKKTKIDDYIQKTMVDNLYVIPGGSIPPNPSELLISEAMLDLVEELKSMYDIVILDGPPTQLVTDSIILSRIVDSTAIVVACKETRKDNLYKMVDGIKNVKGKIVGIVLNKAVI